MNSIQCAPRLLALLIVFSLHGCASLNEEECRGADWRAIGLIDGQSGRPLSRLADHHAACFKYGVAADDKVWLASHEQGLKRYCTPISGLQSGRDGRGYADVCPADTAAAFLSAYWVGQAVANARTRVGNLENQLHAMQSRIAKAAPGKDRDQLIREEERLGGGRWVFGGELYRARQDLSQAEWRADELARKLTEASIRKSDR